MKFLRGVLGIVNREEGGGGLLDQLFAIAIMAAAVLVFFAMVVNKCG